MEAIKVGDKVRHKEDVNHTGIVTRITFPKTYYALKNNIRFVEIDGVLSGSTINMWEKI